jgi:hypothetical protein
LLFLNIQIIFIIVNSSYLADNTFSTIRRPKWQIGQATILSAQATVALAQREHVNSRFELNYNEMQAKSIQ